jgi:hypothetical protein
MRGRAWRLEQRGLRVHRHLGGPARDAEEGRGRDEGGERRRERREGECEPRQHRRHTRDPSSPDPGCEHAGERLGDERARDNAREDACEGHVREGEPALEERQVRHPRAER